jgi:hypothetical protein
MNLVRLQRAKSAVKVYVAFIIGLSAFVFLFSEWVLAEKTVKVKASYSTSPGLDDIRKDLAQLDAYASEGNYGAAGVLFGKDIKARDVYKVYLSRASKMSDELLDVRLTMLSRANTLSLQELGALAQRLSLNNNSFKRGFTHGEQQFQTYKLIEKAVTNLEDAITYWRISNRYRHWYRGSVTDHAADDEILKVKLETAMNAIDELKAIVEAREALTRDLVED